MQVIGDTAPLSAQFSRVGASATRTVEQSISADIRKRTKTNCKVKDEAAAEHLGKG